MKLKIKKIKKEIIVKNNKMGEEMQKEIRK